MDRIRRVWNRTAPLYDLMMLPLEIGGLRRARRALLARIPARFRILEVGAGTGLNGPYYPRESSIVSTDLSLAMLLQGRRSGRLRGQLVVADVQRLPFRRSCFNRAVSSLVFCSVPDPGIGFEECRRVLDESGEMLLLEHVRSSNPVIGAALDFLTAFTRRVFQEFFNRPTLDTAVSSGFRPRWVRRSLFGVILLAELEKD